MMALNKWINLANPFHYPFDTFYITSINSDEFIVQTKHNRNTQLFKYNIDTNTFNELCIDNKQWNTFNQLCINNKHCDQIGVNITFIAGKDHPSIIVQLT